MVQLYRAAAKGKAIARAMRFGDGAGLVGRAAVQHQHFIGETAGIERIGEQAFGVLVMIIREMAVFFMILLPGS